MRPAAEDDPERPDLQPGFWNEHKPPRSAIAEAIQFPMSDPQWADRVITAYQIDARAARRAKRRGTTC